MERRVVVEIDLKALVRNYRKIAAHVKPAKGSKVRARYIVPALRMAALCCFVVALARPQNATEVEYTSTDGVDIMLALDVSGSIR